MRVDMLTKEYPPEIYGGAGVHVTELVRSLRRDIDVNVLCFGAPREEEHTRAYAIPPDLRHDNPALQTLGVNLDMAAHTAGADLVHSHTWYANEAGRLSQLLHGIPHVVTAHSLEPLRPWKAEQLGGGYRLSSDIERRSLLTADSVIAVSEGMRRDILRCYPEVDPNKVTTIHNGIDTEAWSPLNRPDEVRSWGIDTDAPSIVFVGRITRQKGLPFLLKAVHALPPEVQLVLCAGSPDTPEIAAEVETLVSELQHKRGNVTWIDKHLSRDQLRSILTSGTVFACPSVYEPLGIVNLEAMACALPVVGTATGGIPEVVVDGETGLLVTIEQTDDGTGMPLDPDRFVSDLTAALHEALSDIPRSRAWGEAGRIRAQKHFSWSHISALTQDLYARVSR